MSCAICGGDSTHLCKSCGKWLCDSRDCARAAAGDQVVKHPVKTAAFVASHPVQAARIAINLLPPAPGRFR